MPAQKPLPRVVAEGLRELRRAHDVGEQKRHPHLRPASATLFELPQLGLDRGEVRLGTQPLELVPRGMQLEVRIVVVPGRAQRPRKRRRGCARSRTPTRPRAIA